jgi:hypothetical protein
LLPLAVAEAGRHVACQHFALPGRVLCGGWRDLSGLGQVGNRRRITGSEDSWVARHLQIRLNFQPALLGW